MKILTSLATVTLLLFVLPGMSAETGESANLKRGKYLVEQVGMCADCHSPRNEKGEFVRERWLQGSPLHFKPLNPMPFAVVAPPIAGLPGYAKDEQAIKFLVSGVTASGKPTLPPMPQYRFSTEDATAVVAYLRSLK
jgi:mono/diheme cytochrome c family protein